ncbi:helix-turn-helix domain-containing protein [Pseudomonas sp. ADAK13]|uniref:helix-turn-helix domain-containing protein n=1 Tax=Pseudomonas sp. ADAK13 TaxID=2730847 RepID=UPI0014635A60|nr:helix-turn-helix domain-containing protein [Pseudomonas sp. ADAK13]QJI37099.1 helix-turn-helix domain-containing protein [Pseudomonas sp. ADAK13]
MNNWSVNTEHHSQDRRADAWRQALQHVYLSTVYDYDTEHLKGYVSYCISPQGIEFVTLSGSAQLLIGDYPLQTESLWLSVVIKGEAYLHIDEQRTELAAGTILYGATGGDTVALELNDDFCLLTLELPHALFYRRLLNPLSISHGTLSGESATSRLLAKLLVSVAEELEALDSSTFHPVETALTELLIQALSERNAINTFKDPAHAKHFQQICHCIELRLGDSQLSLGKIAEKCHTSERYIQKIFKEAGLGFNQYLRRQRLERCKRDMASQLNGGLSLSEICFRWGFNDQAYFSRVFSAEYGVSPRAYRARQLDVQASN